MSNPPVDFDSMVERLGIIMRSLEVHQRWREANSTSEDTDPATEHAIHETLHETSTRLEGPGVEAPAPTNGELDRGYGAGVELSDRDSDYAVDARFDDLRRAGILRMRLQFDAAPLLVNPNPEDPLADGRSGDEDELGREGWQHDWRLDPFVGCNICFEQRPVEDVWEAPCEHLHCSTCLEILVKNLYTSTRAPACCGEVLPWEEYKFKVTPELATALDAKKEELDSNNRIYCWERTCSTFIGAQGISGHTATCSACQKQTCTKCKATAHAGDCAPDVSISHELEHAEQEGWKRCSQCRMVVEREDGCPHMT